MCIVACVWAKCYFFHNDVWTIELLGYCQTKETRLSFSTHLVLTCIVALCIVCKHDCHFSRKRMWMYQIIVAYFLYKGNCHLRYYECMIWCCVFMDGRNSVLSQISSHSILGGICFVFRVCTHYLMKVMFESGYLPWWRWRNVVEFATDDQMSYVQFRWYAKM